MNKAEEKKLEAAAERLIKKMKTEKAKPFMISGQICAYHRYWKDLTILVSSLLCVPERELFSDRIIKPYNERDLKEFVKFLLKIRKEEELELVYWEETEK